MRGGDVLARIGIIRTGACGGQVAAFGWEQADPCRLKASSISCGISPASSCAVKIACSASASITLSHWLSVSGAIWILILYGVRREPCTRAPRRRLWLLQSKAPGLGGHNCARATAAGIHQALQRLDPALRPPVFGKCAALAVRLDAILGRDRFAGSKSV